MARVLDAFSITPVGDDYLLQIEDEEGETHEWALSVDQLDLIAEEVDRILDADGDDALGVEDEEEEPGTV